MGFILLLYNILTKQFAILKPRNRFKTAKSLVVYHYFDFVRVLKPNFEQFLSVTNFVVYPWLMYFPKEISSYPVIQISHVLPG